MKLSLQTLCRLLPALVVILLLNSCCNKTSHKAPHDHLLWYSQAANTWEEALPIGNGRLGAMVFGKTSHERIQLNDDSMWPADLSWDEPAGTPDDLNAIREQLFANNHQEADRLFVEKFSRKKVVRSHQTMGDLFLDFKHSNITDYKRSLDINRAIATTSFRSKGHLVTQKVFASNPHQLIAVVLTSDTSEGLNGKIRLSRPFDAGLPTVEVSTNEAQHLIMRGEVTQRNAIFDSKPAPITTGVKFETRLKVITENGVITRGEDFLELKNVNKATIYLVANSSFYHKDYIGQNIKDLDTATSITFNKLEEAHIKDYQALYKRVDLQLTQSPPDSLPTNERLKNIKEGQIDPGLQTLLFNYGRYLLISSSRTGTNPANLQGLWNKHIEAPWNADYHLNINLQMNYWLANVTNLDELNTPLFNYIDKLIENGKVTAQKNFGCKGTFIPHATDLWAPTWLRAPTAYWGCSVGAGGWLMQHYWQHYTFTRDTAFLREKALPAIKQSAIFYSDWLIEDPRDGYLVSAPSTSPENRFKDQNGNPVASCLGSAMDQQLIAEVFDNYLQACKILNISNTLTNKIGQQRKQLRPGFILDKDNIIMEWDREYDQVEPGHRHMSHLYGFHPGVAITQSKTPEMMDAVKRTLDHRIANGGAGTGWSRAWLINCCARLFDGDMAQNHIQFLLQKSMYTNLFDAHPPFQIDGNFGYTAGVAEMLLQSHEENLLRILPALPTQWTEGYVKGLKARGNITVDISWKNNKLEEVSFYSPYSQQFTMIYNSIKTPITIDKESVFTYKAIK